MRALASLAVVALLLVAGCAAPTATTDRTATPSDAATPVDSPAATPGASAANGTPRPDPEEDVRGWENGYWANESLNLTPGDGYNESERAALVARAMARVEVVRDMEFERDVDVAVVTRSELGGVGGDGGDEAAATVRRAQYRATFLVGDGENATRRSGDTRTASIRGYYSVRRDEIVIVSPTETPRVDELTLAHELVHAYQFRQRAIRVARNPTADEIAAVRALIEGEANLVERRYERRCGDAWACARPSTDGSGDGTDSGGGEDARRTVHMGLYLLQYFPYAEGEELVTRAYERGGWAAVVDLFRSPPGSTEQVIHPNRTAAHSELSVPDASGADWERVTASRDRDSVVVGERGLATMFMYTAYDERAGSVVSREQFLNLENGSVDPADPLDYDLNYSTGWAGDALATYRNGEAVAYVWRIRWDSTAEAREFLEGYRRLLRYRGGEQMDSADGAAYWRLSGPFAGGYYVVRDGRTVTVVHAPSVDSLGDVWAPAERDA